MSMPVRALPVIQNWDCSGCGACCRVYQVPVTDEERKRIESQGWESDPALAGVPFFQKVRNRLFGRTEYRLNHRADGACVFLGPDNFCRIHGKFGSAAKPLACRVYPFLLVPAGNHWRLGLRFACPTVTANQGRPVAEHLSEVREYARLLEADSPAAVGAAPTPLDAGHLVPWADVLRIAAVFSQLLSDTAEPIERRWRKTLGLNALCRGLRLDGKGDREKAVTGERLSEMLQILAEAIAEETPTARDVPAPGWIGRILFRQAAAVYTRRDHGAEKGTAQRTPLGRIRAAVRFAVGRGRVPAVNALIPAEATFAGAEETTGPLSPAADAMLTRYYRQKIESLQFCGPTNFNLTVWDGLDSLALTFPVILWLAWVLSAGGRTHDDALARAMRLVDDNFGFNKLLGLSRQKTALRLLATRGELPRLVAGYAR